MNRAFNVFGSIVDGKDAHRAIGKAGEEAAGRRPTSPFERVLLRHTGNRPAWSKSPPCRRSTSTVMIVLEVPSGMSLQRNALVARKDAVLAAHGEIIRLPLARDLAVRALVDTPASGQSAACCARCPTAHRDGTACTSRFRQCTARSTPANSTAACRPCRPCRPAGSSSWHFRGRCMAKPICFRLLIDCARRAASRAA